MSIDMTLQKQAIFLMGVYGEIFCHLSDQAEILFLATLSTFENARFLARNNIYLANSQINSVWGFFRSGEAIF